MARRFHVPQVQVGSVTLPPEPSHHARNVLRLKVGDTVELFDDTGDVGQGVIEDLTSNLVIVRVETKARAQGAGIEVHIASAIPKASRADWMIEKLSELGVARFTPLATERSVVLPEGSGKRDRWLRLAEEAARQSGRAGVMKIDPLTRLDQVVDSGAGIYCSTEQQSLPLAEAIGRLQLSPVRLLIGPEGGWTDKEIRLLQARDWSPASLGSNVLRVETAALVAATLALHDRSSGPGGPQPS
jgi:16S rRNA (uracil1498-N3)-methyltransferase